VSGRILPEELVQDGGRPSARMELETYDRKAREAGGGETSSLKAES